MDRGAWWATVHSIGSQRVRHNWIDLAGMHANTQREVLASFSDHESWFDIKVHVWSICYDKEGLNHPQTSLYYISESFPFLLTQTEYMQELSKSRVLELQGLLKSLSSVKLWPGDRAFCPVAQALSDSSRPSSLEADLTQIWDSSWDFLLLFLEVNKQYSSWKSERNSGLRETSWCRMVLPSSNLTSHWCSHRGPRRGLT